MECPVDRCEWGRYGVCFWQMKNCPYRHEVDEHFREKQDRAEIVEAARRRMAEKCRIALQRAESRRRAKSGKGK